MLSAGAYSFRSKSRVAISLSWVAGYVNVIALLHCGYVLSHQSGNTPHFAESLARGWVHLLGIFGLMLLCFFLGSVGSGLLSELGGRRNARSKYTLPIVVETFLLSLFAIGVAETAPLPHGVPLGVMLGLAALAMGLQNATITRISGAVVRTTHMTGVLTDMGLEAVQLLLWYGGKLRGRRWTRARRVLQVSRRHPTVLLLLLLGSIYGSFVLGIVAGALAYEYRPALAMTVPIAFLLWIVGSTWRKPIADVRELSLLDDPELRASGIVQSLLPPEMGVYRLLHHASHAHHAPNFQHWADRLPEHRRVVILALSPLTRFDANAAIDLKGAVEKLHSQYRRLVICGISTRQYRILERFGITDAIDPENICPDLEFAIARGISLVEELTGARPHRRHWDVKLVDA